MSNRMTVSQVESSTGGILVHGAREVREAVVQGISIDSRTVAPGELFFAIRGPNQNGHRFVSSALSKKACGAVVDSTKELESPIPDAIALLQVSDTHEALKRVAAEARRRWQGRLIAVTGSIGKTTTKEFIAHILRTRYHVYHSPGNYNNLFGVPLSLYNLEPRDDFGVFEMGMSQLGEIAELCSIAQPKVGVLTRIAAVHMEFFDSIDSIVRAKGELVDFLNPGGLLVYNVDDERVRELARSFRGEKISFGSSAEADVRASDIDIAGLEGTRFQISCCGESGAAAIPMAGEHFVWNVLPGIALGRHYGIPLPAIVESLRTLSQPPMRGRLLRFKEGFAVIDDSYNSSPAALEQMASELSRLKPAGRRILVAGEMLELGPKSPGAHHECGRAIARSALDLIIAVSGHARELARGAVAAGMQQSRVRFFEDIDSAIAFVDGEVRAGDLLLIKGSRGTRMEKVIQGLQATKEEIVS